MWCLLIATVSLHAQKLTVEKMEVAPMDLSASTQPRNDRNGNPCALVKVQLATQGASFEGSVIGDTEFKKGEYWVYMSAGSYMLNIKNSSFLPLFVNFRDYDIKRVEGKTTYVLTLLMPQGLVPEQKQKLIINYTPKDAMVLIDSKPYTGKGHVEEELPIGDHNYVIAATGYITAEGTIKLNANGPRILNEQLMKESAVVGTLSQDVQISSDTGHSDKTKVQLPASNSSDKLSEETASPATKSLDDNEMALRQMVLHPFGVLPDHDGLRGEGVKSALLAVNSQWEVLENSGGELHVHGFSKTYKGKSMAVWCDFDYKMYKKLSEYVYCFGFKKKDAAQSFFDEILKDMLTEGMIIDGQQASGDNISAKTIYKGRLLTLSIKKRNSSNSKYAVELKVNPHNFKTFTVGDVQFRMIHVEGGAFMMGSDQSSASGGNPGHQEMLADYYIGETEVTQELWKTVMGFNPSSYMYAPCPVERVSWEDCQKFIQKLNEIVKDDDGLSFRLPTEAEWEFAARGGNKSGAFKYSGSDEIEAVAWYEANSENKIQPVGRKQANELGLFDMSGNVWEWCQEESSPRHLYPNDPTSPILGYDAHKIRGGSCLRHSWECLIVCSSQGYNGTHEDIGLRLVLTSKNK